MFPSTRDTSAEFQDEVRRLADRLGVEYAGAVQPGPVLAIVLRASRAATTGWVRGDVVDRLALTERLSRAWLTQRLAAERSATQDTDATVPSQAQPDPDA